MPDDRRSDLAFVASEIDKTFGAGFATANPSVFATVFGTLVISSALHAIAAALAEPELPAGLELARGNRILRSR
jgi:hypothetical protein